MISGIRWYTNYCAVTDTGPPNRRVLISGGGIAGLTLGYWLARHGFQPTIIESAPSVRGGGYMIDFWGLGYDVAERMGIIEPLSRAHYNVAKLDFVDENNRIRSSFRIERMREAMGGRHFSLLRSDLERVLYERAKDVADIRFSTTIGELNQDEDGVDVMLGSKKERFDLVVGADGLRSNTRRLVFGSDEQFEKYLGYYTASFTIENFLDRSDVFASYTEPGRQVGIYPVANHQLATFFIFSQREHLGHLDAEARTAALERAFESSKWKTPALLMKMRSAGDFYFDSVSQIQMPAWSKGRVALAGDACQCVSLVAGQGSALAMAGAYVLAGELKQSAGAHASAFQRYEAFLRPEIADKQQLAQRFAKSFVPPSRFGMFARDVFVRLMFFRFLSRYLVKRFLANELTLAGY